MYDDYDINDSYEEQDDDLFEANDNGDQGYCTTEPTYDDDNVIMSHDDNSVLTSQDDNDVIVSQDDNDIVPTHTTILGHHISFTSSKFDCTCKSCLCKHYEPKGVYDSDCLYCGHSLNDHVKV